MSIKYCVVLRQINFFDSIFQHFQTCNVKKCFEYVVFAEGMSKFPYRDVSCRRVLSKFKWEIPLGIGIAFLYERALVNLVRP